MPGRVALTRSAPLRPRFGQVGRTTRPVAVGISPVEQLSRRLQALTPENPHSYAVTDLSTGLDQNSGWVPIVGVLPTMLARAGDHRSPAVTGARLAGTLGYAVAGRLAVALAVTGRAFDVGPDSLMVQLDDDGLVERIGVRNPVLAVSAADSSVGPGPYPVIRFPEVNAVISWAADQAWTTLGPLIDELHETIRYGRVPMWNLVADAVLSPATVAPGLAGGDQWVGRARGSAFLDALSERGAPIHRRGTLREPMTGGVLMPVRGSCCLHFRQTQEKCVSCPLLLRTQEKSVISTEGLRES